MYRHGDGPHLWSSKQIPIHAVNIFIPLVDITEELGPTEFIPGSHKLSNAANIDKSLTNSDKNIGSISPLLRCGSVTLYDYRLVHRGTGNTHKSTSRHMFYILYTKPWFNEHINFGDTSIFSHDASTISKKAGEDPDCAGYYSHI